jgi:hypothetical protein
MVWQLVMLDGTVDDDGGSSVCCVIGVYSVVYRVVWNFEDGSGCEMCFRNEGDVDFMHV